MFSGFELLLIGFVVGSSFGPVNILVLKMCLVKNLCGTIYTALAAILGDTLILLLALHSTIFISEKLINKYDQYFALTLGITLILLSVYSIIRFNKSVDTERYNSFFIVLALTIISPLSISLWLNVAYYVNNWFKDNINLAVLLVVIGDLIWFTIFVGTIRLIGKKIKPIHQKTIGIVSDLIIIMFAIQLILHNQGN
ncbi:MAG: hypothetical protein Tsb002_34560 [Wenzhouxiangellaceae bacterium]